MPGRHAGAGAARPCACPSCGHVGRAVSRSTVEALLKPDRLATLAARGHRFCPTAGCDVVYFGKHEVFRREDVVARAFCKERPGNRTVCHCFDMDEDAIRRGPWSDGRSAAFHRIRTLLREGRCTCEVRNPHGGCCLAEIAEVEREARDRSEQST